MKRTMIVCTCLAFATLMLVSACSHKEEVRIERETVTPAPRVTPGPPPEVIVRQATPPPLRVEVRTPPPAPGYTWVPGQWVQRGQDWVWRSGHWE
jgi:hypothetical protein